MSVRRFAAAFSSLALLAGLLFSGGCASQPPNQSTLSGKRLIVDMTFEYAVDPSQYYFFVINVSNNINAPGPVPVLFPPYLNGFAIGSPPTATGGFTDFVEYNNFQYQLFHVGGDGDPNNPKNFQNKGRPVYSIPPAPNQDDLNSRKLHFEIDLSQLVYDASGNPITDQTTVVSQALSTAPQNRGLEIKRPSV